MKNKKKYLILSVMIILSLIVGKYAFTFAKYVYNSSWNYYLKTKEFYFASDNLGNDKQNIINSWDGNSLSFNIKNSENDSLITEYDIKYQTKCEVIDNDEFKCNINDSQTNIQTGVLSSFQTCVNQIDSTDVSSMIKEDCEIGGYKWSNQVANTNLSFTVVPIDGEKSVKDIKIKITAASTTPYKKTLTGVFILHKNEEGENNILLDHQTNNLFEKLIISNAYSTNKCVSIEWDSDDLAIDENIETLIDYDVNNDGDIFKIVKEIGSKDTIGITFYKKNIQKIYDKNSFDVNEINC